MESLLYTKPVIEKAAHDAVQSPAPASGADYPFLVQLVQDYIAQVASYAPYSEEKARAKVVCAIGILAMIVAPLAFGWTNMTVFLILTGGFTAFVGGFEAFFKHWPSDVTHATIDQSRNQLDSAGEAGQKLIGPVAKSIYGVLCLADGLLAGTALAERLGQASLTPRTAMVVGLVFSVALAAALFSSIKAAAREAQKAYARKMIRNLQTGDPAKEKAMVTRVGGTLGFAYGTRDDSIKARVVLIVLATFMALTQFGLRLGGFAEDSAAIDNVFNWVAAITVSALIFFTVVGLYVTEQRNTFLDEDSAFSKTVLLKFPDHASLDKHQGKHANKIRQAAQNTVRLFVQYFNHERSVTNSAKTHPTPAITF